jgi:hypothetical protein
VRKILLGFILSSPLGTLWAQGGFFAPAVPPRAQYRIECAFDTNTALLKGSQTVTFRNTTARPMDRLALEWSVAPQRTVTVIANGKPAALLLAPGRTEVPSPLLLQLPELLKPGAELTLKMEFSNTYRSDFDPAGGVLLQAWHPRLRWGFGTHDDYAVRMTVPPGWGVATSGVLDPASGIWTGKDIRDFAAIIFNEKQYSVQHAQASDVQVTVIHTAAGARCAQLLLKTAVEAIDFYRGRFGFYPHRSLTIIPVSDYPAGGYPVATAMVAIHGEEQMEKKPEAHFRWITAHEIGHMYWSQHVMAEGQDDLDWLMIGLGIFADREYRRAHRNTDPVGNLPENYVGGMKDGIDTTMDLTPEQKELFEADYNNIIEHGKSSAMMDALESTIGVDVFDRVYRRCLREFHGRRLSWHDFEKVSEEESGEDLGWFFVSWVRSNEYTSYLVAKQTSTPAGSGWHSEVEIVSEGTRQLRVPVVAAFEDGSRQSTRTDRLAAVNILAFESKSRLKDVKIDPERTVWMLDSKPPLSTADLLRRINRMNLVGSGEKALGLLPRARELRLAASHSWLRLGLMLYDAKHYTEALECFEKSFETAEDRDNKFIALVWQGQLLDLMGKREAAMKVYRAAQATGSTQVFRHDQYNLKIDQTWVQERLQAPYKRE